MRKIVLTLRIFLLILTLFTASCSNNSETTQSPYCGDNSCNGNEACNSCSTDCGDCPEEEQREYCNSGPRELAGDELTGYVYQCTDALGSYAGDRYCDGDVIISENYECISNKCAKVTDRDDCSQSKYSDGTLITYDGKLLTCDSISHICVPR